MKIVELSMIFSCISEQLPVLKTHLMFAQISGIPVSSQIDYFEHLVDRLRLFSGPLSKTYHFLQEPHTSRPVPPAFPKFNRRALFQGTRGIRDKAQREGYWEDLKNYETKAQDASKILQYLLRCLTGTLVSIIHEWSMRNNEAGFISWLSSYSIDILVNTERTTDLYSDFAVLMMAAHRFPHIQVNHVSSNSTPCQSSHLKLDYASLPAPEFTLLEDLYRLDHQSLSRQEINISRSKVILQFFLTEQSDSLGPLSTSIVNAWRQKSVQHLDGILNYKVGIFDSWLERQNEIGPEDFEFSEMVRVARTIMPCATCDGVLVLAQRLDRERNNPPPDEQPGEILDLFLSGGPFEENGALEAAMEETNPGLQTGVSRSTEGAKERPVQKDVLRKVNKTASTKRNDIRGRLGPGVANSIYPEAKKKTKPRVVIQID